MKKFFQNLKNKIHHFFIGSVININPRIPSYEEQFGTDADLLKLDLEIAIEELDWKKTLQDLDNEIEKISLSEVDKNKLRLLKNQLEE